MNVDLLAALEAWPPVASLRVSQVIYPLVSAAHILGVALLIGAIVPVDLRLAGLRRGTPLDVLATALVPVAATGLMIAVASGLALFAVSARDYATNPAFLLKVGLVALGLGNVALVRGSAAWRARREPFTARLAIGGVVSALVWCAALVAGRFIAFV